MLILAIGFNKLAKKADIYSVKIIMQDTLHVQVFAKY